MGIERWRNTCFTEEVFLDASQDASEPPVRIRTCSIKFFTQHRAHVSERNHDRGTARALNVLVCRSRSQMILDKYSHMYELDAVPGGIGLLELPRESIDRPGIAPVSINLHTGGLYVTLAWPWYWAMQTALLFQRFHVSTIRHSMFLSRIG